MSMSPAAQTSMFEHSFLAAIFTQNFCRPHIFWVLLPVLPTVLLLAGMARSVVLCVFFVKFFMILACRHSSWGISYHIVPNLNLSSPCRTMPDRDYLSHRSTRWQEFLNSGRHESEEIRSSLCGPWAVYCCIQYQSTRNWIFCKAHAREMGQYFLS